MPPWDDVEQQLWAAIREETAIHIGGGVWIKPVPNGLPTHEAANQAAFAIWRQLPLFLVPIPAQKLPE